MVQQDHYLLGHYHENPLSSGTHLERRLAGMLASRAASICERLYLRLE